MDGYNATIFAYGQSGSGKTFSMLGPESVTELLINQSNVITAELESLFGIVPRATFQIFDAITAGKAKGTKYLVKVSYLEIYNEAVNDILSVPVTHNLKIREFPIQGMCVIGMNETIVTCPENVFECISAGTVNKIVCSTGQNSRSSRSHTVFVLTLEQWLVDGSSKLSKLNLVDLAGSEKLSKTGAQGQALKEAQKINLSLTTLGRCIKALTGKPGEHVPFRESKLTLILKESLGGNSKTSLIVTASMRKVHQDETMSTLKFAERAKMVKTAARSNVKRSVDELEIMVEQLKAEIANLKSQLKFGGGTFVNETEELQELKAKFVLMQNGYGKQVEELTDALERKQRGDGSDYLEERNMMISRIAELEAEVGKGRKSREGVEGELQGLLREIEKVRSENMELKYDVKSKGEFIEILKKDLKESELHKEQASEEKKILKQEQNDFEEMLVSLKYDLAESNRKNEELQSELEEMVSITESLQKEKQESSKLLSNLEIQSKESSENLKKLKKESTKEITDLKKTISFLQSTNAELQENSFSQHRQRFEEQQEENKRLKEEIKSLSDHSDMQTLASELASAKSEISKLQKEKQNLLQDLLTFKQHLEKNEEVLKCRPNLMHIFSALEQKNAVLEQQLINEAQSRQILSQSLKLHEESREKLIKDLENSLRTKMQVTINASNRKENELLNKLKQKEKELETLKNEGSEDTQQIRSDLKASQAKIAHLNSEIKSLIQDFDHKSNKFIQEKENWKHSNMEKINENLQLKMQIVEKENKINSLKTELTEIQSAFTTKTEDSLPDRDSRALFKKKVSKIQPGRITSLYHNIDSTDFSDN